MRHTAVFINFMQSFLDLDHSKEYESPFFKLMHSLISTWPKKHLRIEKHILLKLRIVSFEHFVPEPVVKIKWITIEARLKLMK